MKKLLLGNRGAGGRWDWGCTVGNGCRHGRFYKAAPAPGVDPGGRSTSVPMLGWRHGGKDPS